MDLAVNAPEKFAQKAILQYLRLRGYLCKRNNSGLMVNPATENWKRRVIRVGEPGWPDIEFIDHRKNGQYVGIEVKSKRGIVSPLQAEVGQRILRAGGVWFVAKSLDEVMARGY